MVDSFLDMMSYFFSSAGNPIILFALGIFAAEFAVYQVFRLVGYGIRK